MKAQDIQYQNILFLRERYRQGPTSYSIAERRLTFVHRKLRACRFGTVAAGSRLITSSSAGLRNGPPALTRSFTPPTYCRSQPAGFFDTAWSARRRPSAGLVCVRNTIAILLTKSSDRRTTNGSPYVYSSRP